MFLYTHHYTHHIVEKMRSLVSGRLHNSCDPSGVIAAGELGWGLGGFHQGVFDVANHSFTAIDISRQIPDNDKFAGAVATSDGCVYMVPYHSDSIGIFNATSLLFTTHPIDSFIDSGAKYDGSDGCTRPRRSIIDGVVAGGGSAAGLLACLLSRYSAIPP